MLYVPISHLRPNMVLARDLPSDLYGISLLTVGQPLTEKVIKKLEERGIQGAYIESSLCDDIYADEMLDSKTKKRMVSGIKKQFDEYVAKTTVPNTLFPAIYDMSSELISAVLAKEEILLNMIDLRDYDTYTYSHSTMVGLISALIGVKLGISQSDLVELVMSGMLHDIGKLDIPVEIINKPGKLTNDEFELIKRHPTNAANRLKNNCRFPSTVVRGIECHHEKFDGGGYPNQIAATDIPLYGRILALADVYDALTSKRPYREAWSPGQAIEYMMSYSNIHFDHELLQVFLSVVAAYPTGTFVRLSNNYLAVVIKNNSELVLRPVIKILEPADMRGREINLAKDMNYLSCTIIGTITDKTQLPGELFKL